MSSSTHWLATAAAQSVLERGGNAFDAVVAGGFVLHVVEPHLNGPGGDLVGLFHAADEASPRVLVGQGPAPAGATIGHMRGEGLDAVPGAGALAAAIPGAVDAWLLLLRDHGTWELADVLGYAIGYARDGHPMLPAAAAVIGRVADLFRESWPSSAALWMPQGRPPVAGELHRNPAYAAVLEELVLASEARPGGTRAQRIDAAREEWRTGRVARAIDAFVRTPHRHSDGRDHAGVLTAADLAGFAASYEEPMTVPFRGRVVAKAGAWSQGPALLQALALLDPLDDADVDPATASGAHNVLEALKLALADRDAHLGDGVDAAADAARMLAADYISERRALIGDRASTTWRAGWLSESTAPFAPPLAETAAGPAPRGATGEPTVARTGETRGDTCQIDVVDRWGNIVAVTPSGGWLQSSPTIPELGFCLGTRLQMTWLDERSSAALRPGHRPRTTLSPTLVLRDGRTEIALGTPGGDQQEQWQLPMLLRMLVGGWNAQQAIDAPTLHTTAVIDSFWPRTWTPAGAVVESRLGDDVIASLAARGHDVVRAADWALGRLSAVGIDAGDGTAAERTLWAAANPRGQQGYAAGR
ncbi:gamma-glutamyltransferase family protein [Microbacterium radiodurans]|uniref:Transferase n=1 Tax=Microbacterium radiodurans TaxID=661398 RepID=A0A5J5ITX8_9MICO|nr:gamma-glutamyltransferase [Microbacterium radiodurans]KAA9087348.1 transferase [Microbacterium radiodurans]